MIGTGTHGAREAVFLRSYTDRVSLIAPDGLHDLQNSDREELTALDIITIDGPARRFELMGDGIRLEHACGTQTFDTVYPALGSVIHSGLAQQLGAELTDMGCIRVDAHQRTTVPGLYPTMSPEGAHSQRVLSVLWQHVSTYRLKKSLWGRDLCGRFRSSAIGSSRRDPAGRVALFSFSVSFATLRR